MRIGLVTGEYPPDQGGVGDFTREIGKALAALNRDVHMITGDLNIEKSSDQVMALRHIHFQTSKVRYFHKFHGRFVGELLQRFRPGNYDVWQLGLEGAKWLVGHKRALRSRLRGDRS